jgi:hypothetical protein
MHHTVRGTTPNLGPQGHLLARASAISSPSSRSDSTSGGTTRFPRQAASISGMGSMVYDTRGRPLRTKFRSGRREPRRAPGRPRKAIPKPHSDANKRARRRRFVARRIAGVLALVVGFLFLGALIYDTRITELGCVQPVSPVQAGTLPESPHPPPPDMGKVWAAAIAGDLSPDLATHGKTGTSGAGSRSLSTTARTRAPRPESSRPCESTT